MGVQRLFMFTRYHRCGQEKHLTVPAGLCVCVCVCVWQRKETIEQCTKQTIADKNEGGGIQPIWSNAIEKYSNLHSRPPKICSQFTLLKKHNITKSFYIYSGNNVSVV